MGPLSHHHRIILFTSRLATGNSLCISSLHASRIASQYCESGDSLMRYTLKTIQKTSNALLKSQALDILVSVRSIHYCTYTPDLSTLCSSRCLTSLCYERSHLKVGFTLRCFQRLSLPNAATRLYGWRHNRYAVGPSTPVLSY